MNKDKNSHKNHAIKNLKEKHVKESQIFLKILAL
jgi:hypothetical protein